MDDHILYIPVHAHFVRFRLEAILLESRPWTKKRGCLPPETLVINRKYHYHPVPYPIEDITPVFLREFFDSETHLDSFWPEHFPKKLLDQLEYRDSEGSDMAWVIEIEEGLNWRFVWLLWCAVLVIVAMATGITWLVLRINNGDAQTGSSVGQYAVGLAMLWSSTAWAIPPKSRGYF